MSMTFNKRLNLKKILLGCGLILVLYGLVTCATKNKTQPPPPPSVIVQKPKMAKLVTYVTQTGTMVAYNAVNLVARIEGYLNKIEFVDGTFVKKGQELFVIEPEPYMDKLKEAQASVDAQKAGYNYATSEYQRQQRMYKQNATSLNNVEKWAAQTAESKAEIAKAMGTSIRTVWRYLEV